MTRLRVLLQILGLLLDPTFYPHGGTMAKGTTR